MTIFRVYPIYDITQLLYSDANLGEQSETLNDTAEVLKECMSLLEGFFNAVWNRQGYPCGSAMIIHLDSKKGDVRDR